MIPKTMKAAVVENAEGAAAEQHRRLHAFRLGRRRFPEETRGRVVCQYTRVCEGLVEEFRGWAGIGRKIPEK